MENNLLKTLDNIEDSIKSIGGSFGVVTMFMDESSLNKAGEKLNNSVSEVSTEVDSDNIFELHKGEHAVRLGGGTTFRFKDITNSVTQSPKIIEDNKDVNPDIKKVYEFVKHHEANAEKGLEDAKPGSPAIQTLSAMSSAFYAVRSFLEINFNLE